MEMYQKAFSPSPPHTTTSTRLAVNSTNYWLVVGENSAWQQSWRWLSLYVNTKIPLLLLSSPLPVQCLMSPTNAERVRMYMYAAPQTNRKYLAHTHTYTGPYDIDF